MVAYAPGVRVGAFKLPLLVILFLYIAEHKDLTVFPDGSVGSRFVNKVPKGGSVRFIGNVMSYMDLVNYKFTIEHQYSLRSNQMPVSRRAYLEASEKLRLKKLAEARTRQLSGAELRAIERRKFILKPRSAPAPLEKPADQNREWKRNYGGAVAFASWRGSSAVERIHAYKPRITRELPATSSRGSVRT